MPPAAIGAGAVCGALCRHQIGKAATKRIAKDPNLKYLTGKSTNNINCISDLKGLQYQAHHLIRLAHSWN